jgi:hypothetical protein
MYTSEQIAARREVKYQTLDALCDMAVLGRMGVRMLWRNEPLDLTQRLTVYWLTVRDDAAALETLRTAKGCTGMPAGAENRDTTLLEFLQDHAAGGRADSCGQAFAHDCALWAAQLANRNRGNERLSRLWRTRKPGLDRAQAEAEREYSEFYARPGQRGPRTPEEAKYLLVWSRHRPGMTKDNYDPLVEGLDEEFPENGIALFTWDRAGTIEPTAYAPSGGG